MLATESILQFGAGRFFRAIADFFVHQAREEGQAIGKIAVVQSTGDDRAKILNDQGGKYHVITRGLENGQIIDRIDEVASISRAIVASDQWGEVLKIAQSSDLAYILSNTTEAGYTLDPNDSLESAPPASFPAKLLHVLYQRFQAGLPPVTVIPCELIEGNARILKGIVLELATKWGLPAPFLTWVGDETPWLNTLVDRIVSGTPKDHPLLATDQMVTVAEPFAFWALENHPKAGPFISHPAITRTDRVEPYFLRKVRILNAAHTALLIRAVPRGFKIVRDAVNDPELGQWLENLLFGEIVPCLGDRVDLGKEFARQTIERFKNPFLDHKFSDIALHHASKVEIRLRTTAGEYLQKFSTQPPLLTQVLEENESLKM
ncbi:MAG: altronate dehydrogenase [Zavarzinella sp.]